jgi:hypothetical protein
MLAGSKHFPRGDNDLLPSYVSLCDSCLAATLSIIYKLYQLNVSVGGSTPLVALQLRSSSFSGLQL